MISILEAAKPVISAEALGLADSAAAAELLSGGLLRPSGYSPTVGASDDHSDTPIAVVAVEGGGYRYFSATAGWTDVEPERLRTYTISLRAIAATLMPSEVRLAPKGSSALLPDMLWNLGHLPSGRRRREVWLGRRLWHTATHARVEAYLKAHPAADRRVILTSSRPRGSPYFELPGTAVIPVVEALNIDGSGLMDPRHFRRQFEQAPAGGEPLWLSKDNRDLLILGAVKLHFRGAIQQKAIRMLVDAHLAGERLPTSTILERTDSAATSLPKLFGTAKWKTMGKYWKKVDDRWYFVC